MKGHIRAVLVIRVYILVKVRSLLILNEKIQRKFTKIYLNFFVENTKKNDYLYLVV